MANLKSKLNESATMLSRRMLPAQKHSAEVTEIPVGATAVRVSLDRFSWPVSQGTIVWVQPYTSLDNGQTWTARGGFGAAGGASPPHYRTGKPQNESWRDYEVAEPNNPFRLLKVEITPQAPIETAVKAFPADTVKNSQAMSARIEGRA